MVLLMKEALYCGISRRNYQLIKYADGIGGVMYSILWHCKEKLLAHTTQIMMKVLVMKCASNFGILRRNH